MSDLVLRLTLLADGTSDGSLLTVIRWMIGQISPPVVLEATLADLAIFPSPPRTLAARIRKTLEYYPADLIFVHRDAEAQDPKVRREEIRLAMPGAGGMPSWVPVVPVRMTEAWLLIDERAIRAAADNPAGKVALELPDLRRIERTPDPKQVLRKALEHACEKRGRRLEQFRRDLGKRIQRVADLMQDLSPLRQLESFRTLEEDTTRALSALGLARRPT